MVPTPIFFSILATMEPAAPVPERTTLISFKLRLVSLAIFKKAAATMMEVPCWSSWKTGMFISSLSLLSMVTHLGAEISSRLMAPKVGSRYLQVLMISSTSCVFKHKGKESTPANSFNRMDLPSMTGMAASGPMLPRPKTAEPSVMTATIFCLAV